MGQFAHLTGRALAFGGTVTTDAVTVTVPTCSSLGVASTAIPTLSEWGTILLAGLLALSAFGAIRPGDSGSGTNTLTGDAVGNNREAAAELFMYANELAEASKRGVSLIVFPEGTLKRNTGLMPFRTGAFQAAAFPGAQS